MKRTWRQKTLALILAVLMLSGTVPVISAVSDLTLDDNGPLICYDASSLALTDGARVEKLANKAKPGSCDAVQTDTAKQPTLVTKNAITKKTALALSADTFFKVDGSEPLELNDKSEFCFPSCGGGTECKLCRRKQEWERPE